MIERHRKMEAAYDQYRKNLLDHKMMLNRNKLVRFTPENIFPLQYIRRLQAWSLPKGVEA